VLGLADEVCADELGVGAGIGDHHAVGGTCEHVDTDLPVEDALGLGDVLVSGADQNVGAG
jgi:hypothetical protein